MPDLTPLNVGGTLETRHQVFLELRGHLLHRHDGQPLGYTLYQLQLYHDKKHKRDRSHSVHDYSRGANRD